MVTNGRVSKPRWLEVADMQFTPDHAAHLVEILRWRRDVRHFRTDPVPAAALQQLRQAMKYPPSFGIARP